LSLANFTYMMISSSIHFPLWLNNTPYLLYPLSVDRHPGWFHNFIIMNSAAINVGVYVSTVCWLWFFWVYIQEWYIAGSYSF
jgi:hypothetical protein